MKCTTIFVLLFGVILTVNCQDANEDENVDIDLDVRQNWGGSRPVANRPRPQGRRTTTTSTTPPPPVPSSNPGVDGSGQLIGCNCPSTPEVNLVCGDDGNTYGNEGKLRCAQRCGHRVQLRFRGSCRGRDNLEQKF